MASSKSELPSLKAAGGKVSQMQTARQLPMPYKGHKYGRLYAFTKKVVAFSAVKHPLNALFIGVCAMFCPCRLMVIKGVDFQKKRGFSCSFWAVRGSIRAKNDHPTDNPTDQPTTKLHTKCTQTPHLFRGCRVRFSYLFRPCHLTPLQMPLNTR